MGHGHDIPMPTKVNLPSGHLWRKLPAIGIAMFVIGGGMTAAAAMTGDRAHAFFAYLVAYMYFLSLGLGCMFFVFIHFVTRAGWSVVVRRLAENVMGTLPVLAVLFLPILVGMHDLYHHWMDAPPTDLIVAGKTGYLNTPFFLARAAFYLITWTALAIYFRKASVAQDSSGDHNITRRLQARSAPAIFLFALTLTFAAIDWIMTLDPHWFSTMFGVYYFAGSVVAMYSLLAAMALSLQRSGVLTDAITTEHYHDLGKYMFAFTVFWSYIAFSQYFLIWYANLPEETIWFEHRTTGGWLYVTQLLMLGHFIIPFFFLMPRTIKRNRVTLYIGAAWILLIHYVDLYWLIMPVNQHHGPHPGLAEIGALICVKGAFLFALGRHMTSAPLIPVKDPRLPESLAFENI